MERDKFEEFDLDKLKKAYQLLSSVCDYYYGYPPMKRKTKRLETIIKKLRELLRQE